jgi:hypothetical protein
MLAATGHEGKLLVATLRVVVPAIPKSHDAADVTEVLDPALGPDSQCNYARNRA